MVLDDRISAEEVALLEKKQAMKELLKERRRTEVEGWRDTATAEGGVAQKAAAGSQSSERSEILRPCRAAGEEKGSNTCRIGGDTSLCVSVPADE